MKNVSPLFSGFYGVRLNVTFTDYFNRTVQFHAIYFHIKNVKNKLLYILPHKMFHIEIFCSDAVVLPATENWPNWFSFVIHHNIAYSWNLDEEHVFKYTLFVRVWHKFTIYSCYSEKHIVIIKDWYDLLYSKRQIFFRFLKLI